VDLYETVRYARWAKGSNLGDPKWIDWSGMAKQDKPTLNEIIATCERQRVKHIMGFQYDWCVEVICQFYATLYMTPRKIEWMTQGEWYEVTYEDFVALLGFGPEDKTYASVHGEEILIVGELSFVYDLNASDVQYGTTKGLLPYYAILNKIIRETPLPKVGDSSSILSITKNLLAMLAPDA